MVGRRSKRGARRLAFVLAGLAGATLPTRGRAQEEGAPSGATPVSEGRAVMKMTKAPNLVHFVAAPSPRGEMGAADVVLALTIDRDGKVTAVAVLASGGSPFDAAARDAAMQFVFEPAEVNGRPAAVKIKYTYSFLPSSPSPSAPVVPVPPLEEPTAPVPPPSVPSAQDIVVRGVHRARDATDVTIAAAQARKVAGTQGDPIKVLENLPGLARPSFGSGQIIVWGAAPNETRTYVDGVEVPALFHGSALRSTVNGDLIRDVTLTPGAYGADYGRAIGGMVRVETKDLPASGVHGYAAVDTLDASAMASVQALGDRVRFAVAGRYGWIDSVLQAVDAPNVDQFFAIPRYSDIQAKLQLRLRDRESLDAVFLASNDDLTQTIPDADPTHTRKRESDLHDRLPALLSPLPSNARRRRRRRRDPMDRSRHEQPRSEPSGRTPRRSTNRRGAGVFERRTAPARRAFSPLRGGPTWTDRARTFLGADRS